MANIRTSGGSIGVIGAVFAGGISAMMLVFALVHPVVGSSVLNTYMTSIPLLLATIPLYFVGLGAGAMASMIAAATGAVGLLVKLSTMSNIGVMYVFVFGIPAVILTILALRFRQTEDGKTYWYPESYLLTAAALYPCVIFLAFVALSTSHPGGLLDITTKAFVDVADHLPPNMSPQVRNMIHTVAPVAARLAPGILGWAWIILTMVGVVLAQIALEKLGWNIRSPFTLQGMHTPQWLVVAFGLSWLVGLLAAPPYDYVGKNLGMLLGLPFFFVGLAIVHAFIATTKIQTFLMVVFYLVLSVIIWMTLLVMLLGIIDQWVDFRRRWIQPKLSV